MLKCEVIFGRLHREIDMSKWVLKGLTTGIRTTGYPAKEEAAPGISPGRPAGGRTGQSGKSLISACPTGAISISGGITITDYTRCINCSRCRQTQDTYPIKWTKDYEWASAVEGEDSIMRKIRKPFRHSLHIRIVDGGACGACLSEISQTGKPCYNIHRLGFFITPTPRTADVLMVTGPVTDHMRFPVREAYEAMPEPKAVVAVGACALSGGIFGRSFASCGGVSEVLPVDIAVPGCPPPPLAIIHGLLVLTGRRPSVSLLSPELNEGRNKG